MSAPQPPSHSTTPPRVMVETAFLASTTAILFLINFYFPIGPFLRMLFPLPAGLLFMRWGGRSAWMMTVVAALLLAILMGPTRSIQYLIPHGITGITLGWLWRLGVPWAVSLTVGTLISSIGLLFQVAFLSVLVGENIWQYAIVQVTGLISWILQLFGSLDQPDIAVIQVAAVGMIAFSSFAYQILVHLVGWFLLDRLGNAIPNPPRWLEDILA
ncbi:MAG: DUF2232 domain-containing protein [Pseudanabaenaceae cyanobacterium]